ncbi:recombinase family protein [Paraconexibacter sp.]|uniref:recombinase family protein n=1 Tax=Paraconexibacter sp. TaxID=2949640 RepID=UPI00356241F5
MSPTRAADPAVIYARVSSAKQAEKDLSLPAQITACAKKAEHLGAEVVEEFVERGESGTTANRPALRRMLTQLQAGSIDYVIVHKIDRLARNRADDVAIVMAIRKTGAQLVSVSENVDETPSGLLLHGVMSSIAEFYSRNLANEVMKGTREKAKQGGTPYRAPIGYLNTRVIIEDREVRTITVDPERAPLITEAFLLYATGQYALSELAAILEAKGLRSRARRSNVPKPLGVNQLAKLLRSRYYVGIVEYAGKTYQGRHEPLIDAITFQTVQEVLDAKRQSGERSWRNHHYLRGSVYCAECGGRLFFTRVRGNGGYYDYFVCRGRQEHTCSQPNHRVGAVETAIERYYATVTLPEETRQAIRDAVIAHVNHLASAAEMEIKEAKATEIRLAREERKLLAAHYADRISDALFASETDRISRERAAAQKLVETLEVPYQEALKNLDTALELLDNVQAAYLMASDQERRLFNQAIFKRLEIASEDVSGSEHAEPFGDLLDGDFFAALNAATPHVRAPGAKPRYQPVPAGTGRQRASQAPVLACAGASPGRPGKQEPPRQFPTVRVLTSNQWCG